MGCANAARGILVGLLVGFALKFFHSSGGGKWQGIHPPKISVPGNGQARGRQAGDQIATELGFNICSNGWEGAGRNPALGKEEELKSKGKSMIFPHSALAKQPARSLGRNYFATASPAVCETPSVSGNLSKPENVFL